jgi:hypothetical protein
VRVNNITKIFHIIIVLIIFQSCSKADTIHSIPKNIILEKDFVLLEGKWEQTTKKIKLTFPIIPKINSTQILCYRQSMQCVESEAKVITPQETKDLKENLLTVDRFEYQIIEWSDTLLRAKREAPVADVELRVSFADKSADKSFSETRARGSETANPEVFGHWILK